MLDQQVQGQVLTDKPVVTGTATASAAAFEWHHHQYSSVAMMNLNELDESNLIDMLQVLTKRRDELRLIDKQLFDLMAECFVRLKPAGKELARSSSCSGSSSGFEGSNSSPASSPDDGAMDLSRLAEVTGVGLGATEQLDRSGASYARQEMGGRQEEKQEAVTNKRSNLASPSLHFKKQRLLSAIISTDDIGEKQQVLAEKELDVRNDDDGRPLISNKQQQQQSSFKLIACNSSYQQLNNNNNNQHHREEYHQDQQQQQPQQQAELIGTTQLMGSLAGPSLPAQYREQQFLVDGVQSSSQAIQFQFDSGHTSSASDHDDDSQEQSASIDRPQLKKFCSIGSAEMSFERFSRQQHLIDSTLATLNQSQQQQQPTTTRQANSGMLVPLVKTGDDSQQLMQVATSQQQHHSGASSLGYSIELAPAYSKGAPQAALLAPTATTMMMMMPTAAASTALAQSQNPPDMVHRLYDQFLQCQQKSPSGQLMDPTNQPALIYQQQQQHHLQGHQTPAGCAVPVPLHAVHGRQPRRATGAPSAFEQLLVNAKDLGPIVRKMSFRCHVCSSCFEDRHRLQQHLSIHLNLHPSWFEEKTIKETMAQYEMRRGDYLCQPCQLRFETTSEFDRHMHLHGDKPHQCELCSQENKFVSFRYFRQLLTHLRSHCFLYSCRFVPECRQTANRKDYLKLHILKHHLNNKLPEQYTICCH